MLECKLFSILHGSNNFTLRHGCSVFHYSLHTMPLQSVHNCLVSNTCVFFALPRAFSTKSLQNSYLFNKVINILIKTTLFKNFSCAIPNYHFMHWMCHRKHDTKTASPTKSCTLYRIMATSYFNICALTALR